MTWERGAVTEVDFDGLVGPTHNYGGLSAGNVASMTHGGQVSSPKEAAKQGLAKMRFVSELGVAQAVLPPHPRPNVSFLRQIGFSGSDEAVLARAAAEEPHLLRLACSAAAMWTANAATVAPSPDTRDGRLHVVPANLHAMTHRALEADVTHAVLSRIFQDPTHFAVHPPLPPMAAFADEGAANHTRLAVAECPAIHLFAWGRSALDPALRAPRRHPGRQTLEASRALVRRLALPPDRVLLPQQHPDGIDAGSFHTDVLAVGSGGILLWHELAFVDAEGLCESLKRALGHSFRSVFATAAELPVEDAVAAYPFNSQLLQTPDGSFVVIAPEESRRNPAARAYLERVVAEGVGVRAVHFLDLRQSMKNGGGPACLRLRVPMTDVERKAVGARVLVDSSLLEDLEGWVERHYRDRLAASDLEDPALWREVCTALDELTQILRLGSVYPFQKNAFARAEEAR
jgi:succinylarginine dihydrolase